MTIENEFRHRVREILDYLDTISRLERRSGREVLRMRLAGSTVSVSRASTFIMIYNCVEFAIRKCLVAIRRDIVTGGDFSGLRQYWKEEITKVHFGTKLANGINHNQLIKEFVAFSPGSPNWLQDIERLPFAGNIDHRKLIDFAARIENRWKPPQTCLGGSDLALVRDKRNDLAHGVETFENVGSQFTTYDIVEKLRRIRTFVVSIIRSLERYRQNSSYRQS